jgi:hypothetical protein
MHSPYDNRTLFDITYEDFRTTPWRCSTLSSGGFSVSVVEMLVARDLGGRVADYRILRAEHSLGFGPLVVKIFEDGRCEMRGAKLVSPIWFSGYNTEAIRTRGETFPVTRLLVSGYDDLQIPGIWETPDIVPLSIVPATEVVPFRNLHKLEDDEEDDEQDEPSFVRHARSADYEFIPTRANPSCAIQTGMEENQSMEKEEH